MQPDETLSDETVNLESETAERIHEETTAETVVEALPENPVEPEAVMPEPVKPETTVEELPEEPTLEEPPAPPEPEPITAPATKPKEPEPKTEITPSLESSEEVKKDKPVVDTPSQVTDKPVLRDTPVAPAPQVAPPATPSIVPTPPIAPAKHDPKNTKGVPEKVLELTDEEIDAARKLWAREHIDEARNTANANRRKHMNEMLDQIEVVVKASPNTTTHKIANSLNISEQTTSGYLQKLVKAGRIKASGNSRNRRYYK